MIVGLTGGIGAGKSAVSRYLNQHFGIPVTDADLMARQVVAPDQPAFEAIIRRFPKALAADGSLDRAWLRAHVLPDNEARHWLESVTHPAIRNAVRRTLQQHQGDAPYQLLDSPLLLETEQDRLCDWVVVVDATEEQQIARTRERDGNDEALVRSIMSRQWPRQRRLQAAHLVVDNTGPESELPDRINHLHQQLLERARQHE